MQLVVERAKGRPRQRGEERRGLPPGLRERGAPGTGGRRAARCAEREQFLRRAGFVEPAREAEPLRKALVRHQRLVVRQQFGCVFREPAANAGRAPDDRPVGVALIGGVDGGLEVGHERAKENPLGKRIAGALPRGEERFGRRRREDGGRASAPQRTAAAGVRG